MTHPATPEHYKHHRFPAEIISHGVWLYYRFCLSYRAQLLSESPKLSRSKALLLPQAPSAVGLARCRTRDVPDPMHEALEMDGNREGQKMHMGLVQAPIPCSPHS